MRRLTVGALACGFFLATAAVIPASARPPGFVDAERMQAAAAEPDNWLATVATTKAPTTRLSPESTTKTSANWGLPGHTDLGTYRGQEATPIVVDGVMYTSGTWGYVYAVDAATGSNLAL